MVRSEGARYISPLLYLVICLLHIVRHAKVVYTKIIALESKVHFQIMTLTADELRQKVYEELASLGFELQDGRLILAEEHSKEAYKRLHEPAVQLELAKSQQWLKRKLPRYISYFATGLDIIPEKIRPILVEARERWHHDLFRIARLTWSLPYSQGFGRRLRFLILDEYSNTLMGVLCLQSPPLSFPPRDEIFNYPEGRKTELVNQTMDIQTLGAAPPYNRLLGGKLVALAAASNEVREAYQRKYAGRETLMEERILPAHLVALTTTSAFGRSSIYNRLKYNGEEIASSIGYTMGYGSFHLIRLYPLLREFLESQGISTRGGYGTGPRKKWQTMKHALQLLGFPREMLRHGLKREAFLFPLVHNLSSYLDGYSNTPQYKDLPFNQLASFWCERWLISRAERVDGWHNWNNEQLLEMLINSEDSDELK